MPDTDPTDEDVRSFDELERDVLHALTLDRQSVWTVDDLGRAVNSQIGAVDAVVGLLQAGLIHKTRDGFVIASYAGCRAVATLGANV